MKLHLKYYPQHKDYTCGPSSLRMVFEHLGKKYSEKKMTSLCKTDEEHGTSHENIINTIIREKFEYFAKNNGNLQELIDCIESGYFPIINFLDPLNNKGHYAVVTGYTEDKKSIIIADPFNGNDFTIRWKDLKKKWNNGNKTSPGWFIIIGREPIDL